MNEITSDTEPYKIGIYFPFKTGEGMATIESAVPDKYLKEDKTRENYLGDLFNCRFKALKTIPQVLNFDEKSSADFKEAYLCSKDRIIRVLYYIFKKPHIEVEDDGRMEIRPPFIGYGPPMPPEGEKFDRERNAIFFNIGQEPPYEFAISWRSRRLELLLPIATFVIGLLLGIAPFFH